MSGDRGSASVAALTFAFVFMAGAFVWLSTTVDGALHDRTQAGAVAFQAARAAAQQLDVDAARHGKVQIDPAKAASAARAAVARLLRGSGDSGSLSGLQIRGRQATATVTITTNGRAEHASATVTASAGVDRAER